MEIKSISFFCPAYYDENNIEKVVSSAERVLKSMTEDYEIIIVEDGSPDNTAEICDDIARRYNNIKVIHHKENQGYGAALKDGFINATKELIAYSDGDNQFDLAEFTNMFPLLDSCDIVIGYRINRADSLSRKIQSKVYNTLAILFFNLKVRDVNCAMKVYKRKVLGDIQIESSSVFINIEMLVKAKKKGYGIKEVGVHHYPRLHGKASGAKPKVVFGTIKDLIKQWIKLKLTRLKCYIQ